MKNFSKILSCILSFILLIPSCFGIGSNDMNKIRDFYNEHNRIINQADSDKKVRNLQDWITNVHTYISSISQQKGSLYAGKLFIELVKPLTCKPLPLQNYTDFTVRLLYKSNIPWLICGTFHYQNSRFKDTSLIRYVC